MEFMDDVHGDDLDMDIPSIGDVRKSLGTALRLARLRIAVIIVCRIVVAIDVCAFFGYFMITGGERPPMKYCVLALVVFIVSAAFGEIRGRTNNARLGLRNARASYKSLKDELSGE